MVPLKFSLIKPKKQLVTDANYISEQDALGTWLLNQPQQVRDDFSVN